jgi:hypothetical protein
LEGPAAYQCLFFLPFILSSSYICAVSRRRALDFNIPKWIDVLIHISSALLTMLLE